MKDKYSQLQLEILKNIIKSEKPDYQTIPKEVNRTRLTVRQSIQTLSKKQCIISERITSTKKKNKLIFKPTNKGFMLGLGFLDIKFDQIKNNPEKVIELSTYQEFKHMLGADKLNEVLKILSNGLINYNLINNNLNQIFSDVYSINKMMLRFYLLSQLLNQDFDIENLFYPDETLYKQNVKDVVPPRTQKPLKIILVKIRDNLQKYIDLLPE